MRNNRKPRDTPFNADAANSKLTEMLAKKDEFRKKTLREMFAPILPKVRELVEAGISLETIADQLSNDASTQITLPQLKRLLATPKPIKVKANPAAAQRPSLGAL